jgi:fatty acid desaturase
MKTKQWSAKKLEAFGQEISAIGIEAKTKMGREDLHYIKKIKKISMLGEIIGRTMIHFSIDPFTWSVGVLALGAHLQLETSEIGHSALHGCWDGLVGAEEFSSATFEWNAPVDETAWKQEHNFLHHQFTNIVGRDPDLNYGGLRIAEQTPWQPSHLVQLLQFFLTAPAFMWVIGFYATGLTDLTHGKNSPGYAHILPDRKPRTILKSAVRSIKKMIPYAGYQFGLWPALAGPQWLKVLAANLCAETLKNVYTCATIYAGHFGDDLKYLNSNFKAQGRGAWYKAQIEAAHDFEVPRIMSILCGALDYQIEHHLFPKLPPNRLREVAPKVQAVCEKYGVPYVRTSWEKCLGAALKRLGKMSVPSLKPQPI